MITLIKRGASYNSLVSEIDGLSSETKPVTKIENRFIGNGSIYTEIDTGKKFMYDKENTIWHEIKSDSGGDSSAYAHSLELTINSQTYVLTATLKNTSGEVLGTPQTIDLPLETMVVGGSYDDTTKKVILTLKNGNTVDFSVADLVSGLQTEITSSNKLNSDLISDTNQNNKFVTSAEKTKIANALTSEEYNAGKTTPSGTTYTIDGTTYTVGDNAEVFNDYIGNRVAGSYSHAEGINTKALYNLAHAEGGFTTASNVASHAEGGYTTASGEYSHAEGVETTASDAASHAEGVHTIASGAYSHAEGERTIASSTHQHVQGKYNVEDSNSKYAFIIGNGTDTNNRSNAFAVDWNGLIYVNNASTGVNVSQLQPLINSSNKLSADFIDDSSSINKLGLPTIDIDFSKSNIDTIPEDKRYLIQENKPFAFRDTDGGILSEYRFPLSIVAQTTETGGLWGCELQIKSHYYATIYINLATFTYSVQYWNLGTLNIDDSGSPNKFVTVDEKTKIANALTEEVYNAGKQVKTGNNIGEIFNEYSRNVASGIYSHAEGNGTTASGGYSHAEGNSTTASGYYSHVEGSGCYAIGNYSHAEGGDAIAKGAYTHVEGRGTRTNSSYQHVQGKYNVEDSSDKYAFIIGNGTDNNNRSNALAVDWEGKIYVNNSETGVDVSQLLTEEVYNAGKQVKTGNKTGEIFNNYTINQATGDYSHAEGTSTIARGSCSHTEGSGTVATGNYSHAEGGDTIASGHFSHVEGRATKANSSCQHVQGKYNIEDSSDKYAFIIGNGTDNDNRSNALAVDWEGKIYVNNSATGVDVSDLLARIIALENKVAALENA